MLGKPNGSIGKWGRFIRVNDAEPTQVLDQNGTGRLAEWRKAGTALGWLDNDGKLTAAGLAAIVASQAAGDLLYASSATAMARLAIGATDDFLTIQGGLPVWSKAFDPVFVIGGDNTTARIQRLRKSRGTVAAPTVIVTGDKLGELSLEGYDGSNYLQSVVIRAISEGTIAGTRLPAKLSILVNTDAAPSVLTERLSIDSAGLISLPAATAAASGLQLGNLTTALYAVDTSTIAGPDTFRMANLLSPAGTNLLIRGGAGADNIHLSTRAGGVIRFGVYDNGQSTNIKTVTGTKTTNSGTGTETVSVPIALGAKNPLVHIFISTILAGAGLTTFRIGHANGGPAADEDAWGAAIAIAAGTATDVRNFTLIPPLMTATTFDLTFKADAGVFSSGVIRYTVSYEDVTAATS